MTPAPPDEKYSQRVYQYIAEEIFLVRAVRGYHYGGSPQTSNFDHVFSPCIITPFEGPPKPNLNSSKNGTG